VCENSGLQISVPNLAQDVSSISVNLHRMFFNQTRHKTVGAFQPPIPAPGGPATVCEALRPEIVIYQFGLKFVVGSCEEHLPTMIAEVPSAMLGTGSSTPRHKPFGCTDLRGASLRMTASLGF
jgi:hypothetical protein